ncbi:hemicentin-1-like isoform X4 [Oculina patagonica]
MIAPLRSLPNWWFVVVAISLSNAPVIEAAVQINITLLVDNPTTVHVNTPVVYLRWNYSIGGDEDFKEVDFHYGSTDVYIGYIDPNRIVVASKFKERFDLEKPGTLIIHNVTESDTGTYIFDVKTTQATKFSSTVYLDVLFPVRFIDTPTNKTIIETEIVTFFCNATGNPTPTIKWFREGQSVGTGNPLSFPVYRNHSGYYLCTADNDLNVTLNASAYLEVHYPSEIDNLPSDKTVIEGYNVTLHCNATGNPTPNVTWTKDGSQTVLQQGREFSITNISRQQHGSYKCSAWNYVGQPAVANFSITVHFKPSVSVQLCPSSFTEGSNVTLHCNATGNPPPTITWIQRKTGDILASSEQLFLAAVNRSQAGPYQCHASNGIGSNSSRICNLDVLYQPTGTSMTTMPTNTTLLHDSNMLLNCSTDANPEAHVYHFYFNDALTGNSSSGMLNVTVDEDGVYTCVPINTVGTGHNATVSITAVDTPSVDIDTTMTSVIEGNNITFSCNASGKPEPVITWAKVGEAKVLSQSSSFTVVNVSRPETPNNMIQYQCTASNGVGTSATATVNVAVHFPPEIVSAPSASQVTEGSGAILFCNATGNPQPNITWTKQGNNSELSSSENLNLTNLMREDDGSVYKCTATNYIGSAEATAKVTVWFEPSITSQQCSSPVTEGDNATLHCNATGNPLPNIAWIKTSTKRTVSYTEILFIEDIKRNESGSYECLAWNGIGNNSTNSCTIDVHYLPTALALSTTPANTTVLRGATLELYCRTDANPAAHMYNFYLNDNLIGNSSSGVLNVTVDEDGVYTCVPINTVGTGHNATVSITTVVAPSVEVSNTALIVLEANNISLTCNASGKPQPSITWTKVGSLDVLSNTSSLTIVNVSRPGTPDNMIQYQCTASNGVETPAAATVNVTVQFPPQIDSAQSASQVIEGSGAMLFCNATGNPQPNITWTKQGNNSELSTSENLNLTNLMREDDGSVYKCTATNYIGSAETTTTVTVFFPPKSAIHDCPNQVPEDDNVTLYCNATGNPPPKVAWIRSGEVLVNDGIHVIPAINRSQAGTYECMAWNGIGNNFTTNCTVDVQYPPTSTMFTTLPSNTTVLRGADASLKCTTVANPAAHIYHFYLNNNLIGNSSSGVLNVTVKADGVYTCVPINTVGTGDNATVSVTAVVGPFADIIPQVVTVTEGGNITLTCNVSGVPSPTILWTQIGSSKVLSQNSTLTVMNVSKPGTPDNMIQYQCSASNGVEKHATATVNVTVHFPPQIDSVPSASQVIEGSGVILFCNATGNPQPNITWTKQGNNSELSSSETLNLTNLMREDDGSVYKCTVTNYIGSAETTTTVTVFFPPRSVIHDCPNQVLEGDNVTLYCNATGNPPPKVAWIRSGQVLVKNNANMIPSINRSQAGTYECIAWNGIGNNFTTNCTVDVQYPPASTMITTLPSNTTVLINAAVSLMCATVANPAAHIYHFYLNNNLIGNSSSGVLNITVKADGVYTCVPINMVGTGDNATVSVTAVVAPFAEIIPQVVTVIEGGNFTLTCNVSGVPSPSILWTQIGSSKVLSQNSTLTVMNVSKPGTPDNMIQYQCSASNGVEKRASVTINITVHFVPEILQAPSSTSLLEGNNATLLCRVTGSPLPNITWIKTGDNRTLSTSETLHLENLTRVDDKTEYRCIAKNSIGSAEALAVVTVQYPSLFESSPVHQVVLEGSNLTLHCNATGNPTPNITWTKDGSSTVLHQGETFRIANIQRQAAGDYKCTAWNGVGEQKNATVTITVHYNSVINWTPSGGVVLEGSNLTLHCNATGNPTPNITWTKDGSSTVLHQGETYSIGNIQRQAAGDYKCTAWNGVGERKNATATVTVHFPPKSAIHDCPNQVTEGDNVTLYCNATGNPPPKVAWIRSGQVLVKDNTYLIPAINRSQAETYECMTWNGIGNNITTNCTVDVQYPPASTMITTLPSNTTLLRDAAVSLKCTTVANPAAHIYHFYLNNNLIGNSSSGVLNVTVKADGVYTCVPVNTVGKGDNATVSISAVVAPFAEIIPQVVTVTEGGNFTLTCNVSGVPSPTILWTQIGSSKVLSQNSTLTVMNVSRPGTPDNMIQYQCSASNGVEKRASATVNVTVHFLPEIVKAPSSTSVIEGNNTTLLCRVTGSPLPNITWIKTGDNRTLSTSETLHLENLTRVDDETEYRCIAKNSIGSAEALAVVTVHYPSLLGSAPVHEVVLEGSNLTLQCNATGNPTPNITWTKDGNSTVLHKGETYSIVNIQRQAAGDYKCTAWNGVGERKNATATVTVHFPAAIVSSSSNTVETEASNVTIYCNATGNPTPNITWTRRGSSAVLHHRESYIIYNITRNQAGDYICSAWNKIKDKDNATITITVQYPATIESSSGNRVVLEGNNLTLHCNATGNPTPNITWTKDGSSTVLYQGETYRIVNIQRQAAGDYKCTAWNGVGERNNVTATVTVHFPAAIVSSSSNTVETEASNVTIYCNATGNPTPNITWTRRGSSAVLHHGESYIIYNITRNQAGDYICSVWNKIKDKDNATITVTVQYPSAIESSSGNRVVLEGNNLTLHCNATGNPTPNITWTKDGSSTVLHQGERYSIVNIQRQAAGDYKCTAWNGLGEQKNATVTVDVHYAADIISAPNNKTVVEYDTVIFICNATSNPPSQIIWTQDGNSTVLHQGDTFIIENITRKFNGRQYTCTTQNNVTQDVQAHAHVTVHYSPEVLIKSISPVVEGDNLLLACHVTGNPPPKVLWIRGSDNSVITQKNIVILTNITRADAVVFQCFAWNGIGKNASSNVTVDVLYPAEIVTSPVDQVVWVGEPVALFCNATGNPAPNISYSVVGENGTVGIAKTLVINSSSVAYVKVYTCAAENGLQPPATANVTVTVLVRPCSSNPCLRGSCTDLKTPAYRCKCSIGYQGTNCDEPIPQETVSVKGEIKLKTVQSQYHPDYKNHSSKRFKELSRAFEDNVTELYKDENQFGHVKVEAILNGSIVVNFTLVFLKGNQTVDQLLKILEIAVENRTIHLLPVERDTLRLILPTTPAPSASTTIRTVRAPSAAAQRKQVASWMIALMGGIGGLIFLVLVCAIIHCCVHGNRKTKKEELRLEYEDDTGRWIDLPHVKNGFKPSENELALTNSGAYLEEGPTVEEPLHQEHAIEEQLPGVRTVSGGILETNGNSTRL